MTRDRECTQKVLDSIVPDLGNGYLGTSDDDSLAVAP